MIHEMIARGFLKEIDRTNAMGFTNAYVERGENSMRKLEIRFRGKSRRTKKDSLDQNDRRKRRMARNHESALKANLKKLRAEIQKSENLRFVYHVFDNKTLELMVKTVPLNLNEFKLIVTARNKQKYAQRFVNCIQNYIKTKNVDLAKSGITFEQSRDANLEKSSYFCGSSSTTTKTNQKKRKGNTKKTKKTKKKKKKSNTTASGGHSSKKKDLGSYNYNGGR